jgi:EAL domain-containing protein (putative c-di-GMP-specific phosphodiesterase class I)
MSLDHQENEDFADKMIRLGRKSHRKTTAELLESESHCEALQPDSRRAVAARARM